MYNYDWLTNDSDIAERLKAADKRFEASCSKAAILPCEAKLKVYRIARNRLSLDYAAILKESNHET